MSKDELTEEQREYIGTIPNERHPNVESYLEELKQDPEPSLFPRQPKSRAYDE